MHLRGTRRAALISLVLSTVLALAVWRVARLYAERVIAGLVPTLISRAEEELNRELRIERLDTSREGFLVAEGVRVSRGKTFKEGTLLSADRLELAYDPALLVWSTLTTRGAGMNTRARLRVDGVRFRQPVPEPDEEFFSARSARLELDLGPLLRQSGDVLATVPRVDLEQPRLALRRGRDGKWNVESLFRRKKDDRPTAFRGEIVAHDSTLTLEDLQAPPQTRRHRFLGDLALRFAGFPVVQVQAGGSLPAARGTRFRTAGNVHTETRRYFFSLSADTPDLAYWSRMLAGKQSELTVLGGGAGVQATVWGDSGEAPPGYSATLQVRDGAAKLEGLGAPFRQYRGRIGLTPELVTLKGTVTVASVPVTLDGSVTPGERPASRFRLGSRAVSLAALKQLFPEMEVPSGLAVPSPLALGLIWTSEGGRWNVEGTAETPSARYDEADARALRLAFKAAGREGEAPSASGTLTAETFTYEGTPGRAARVEFRLRDRLADVTARANALGGEAWGRGWIDLAQNPLEFYVRGRVDRIDLAALPVERARELKLAGTASAEFLVSGTAEAPVVTAFVRGEQVAATGEQAAEVSGRVRWESGRLEIPYAQVRDPRFNLALRGTVTEEGELDLRVTGAGLDLEQALTGRFEERVRGRAFASAVIRGTVEEPRIEGMFQVYRPEFREHSADYLEGAVSASSRDVQVSRLKLIRQGATVTADEVTLHRPEGKDAEWEARGEVTVEGMSVIRALRLAGATLEQLEKAPLAGDLGPVRLSVAGPVSAPRVGFQVESPALAFRGHDLGRVTARGTVDTAAGRIAIAEVVSRGGEGEVTLAGVLQYDPKAPEKEFASRSRIEFAVRGGGVRLTPLLRRYAPDLAKYAEAQGTLEQVDGKLTGTLAVPAAEFTLTLEGVVANERALGVEPFRVYWTPEVTVVRGVTVRAGSGVVTVPYLAMLRSEMPPKDLYALLPRLAGRVEVRGLPVAVARQLLQDSPYYETDDGEGVRRVLAPFRGAVRGSADLTLTLPAGAGAVPESDAALAAALRQRKGQPLLTGTFSAEGVETAYGGGPAEAASEFDYSDGVLRVARLRLERAGGEYLTASGTLRETGEDALRMKLAVEAAGWKVGALASLAPAETRERLAALQPLDGELRFRGELSGRVSAPQARFSLDVVRPTVAGVPFDLLEVTGGEYGGDPASLRVASTRLLAERPGGERQELVTASGSLPLTWPELAVPPDRERRLAVQVPRQSLKFFLTLAEDTEALARESGPETVARKQGLTDFFRRIAETEGVLLGEVVLGGTAEKPSNTGYVAVAAGSPAVENFETRIRNFSARVDLEGDLLTVTRFEGFSSEGGSFTGGGTVRLGRAGRQADVLDLTLDLNEVRIEERRVGRILGPAFRGSQARGTLQTVSRTAPDRPEPIRITGSWSNPRIEGGVKLDKAALLLTYEGTGGTGKVGLPLDARLGLDLLIGNDVWLRNAQVRLKADPSHPVSAGSVRAADPAGDSRLRVSGTLAQPVVIGELRVSRGTFDLPGMRLRNGEGSIRVAYDSRAEEMGVARAPVTLDLSASTTIRRRRSAVEEAEDYDVTVTVRGAPGGGGELGRLQTGTASGLAIGAQQGLVVTVRTDPPLPGNRIEALIRQQVGLEGTDAAGANVVEALRSQIEGALAANVSSALTGRIEDAVQSALKLDIFAIDVGVTQPLRVRLGKRLIGQLYGTVSQEFLGRELEERRFELYYRLTPNLRVGFRQEEPFDRKVFFLRGTTSF